MRCEKATRDERFQKKRSAKINKKGLMKRTFASLGWHLRAAEAFKAKPLF